VGCLLLFKTNKLRPQGDNWLLPLTAHALSQTDALAMVQGSNSARLAAIDAALPKADPQLEPFLLAMSKRQVRFNDTTVVILRADQTFSVETGQAIEAIENSKKPKLNNRLRRALKSALSGIRLFSPDAQTRMVAANKLAKSSNPASLALLARALKTESDPKIAEIITLSLARSKLTSADPSQRIEAANTLAASDSMQVRDLLTQRLADNGDGPAESDADVRIAVQDALDQVDSRISKAEMAATLFSGVSLGSILLLAALGLAITYGLMGVINLAHGELMMIGAYATYVGQQVFRLYAPPQWFDMYLLLAIPLSFLVAGLVGILLERLVIRHLYGRALETLLATWGISLILMQSVRNLFGAQNVAVENPSWMSGGWEVTSNLVLPYNRIAIIGFAILVLALVALILARTRLGLFVRATIQNRTMARCVGVQTARTDMLAFGLGAGVAGLAGCALSQIGNVGPDLGQSYIVDSFLVVVVGGVGQLAGAVVAALGLGIFGKVLEGLSGAVIAKIVVLVMVIVFIQRRPQGIFALKGRAA